MAISARAVACVCISVLCLAFSTRSVPAQGLDVVAQAPSPAITIKAVEIHGNKRVDRSTVLFYIKIAEGKAYTNVELVERIREDVRTIYGLGFFRDVKVDVEPFEGGLRVVYRVTEKPTIRKVEFQGNINVDEEDIRERLTVKVQTIINEATIKETVRNIRKLYQEKGYYFARVEAVLKEGTRNTVDVTLVINEGERVAIETIIFRGNENISRKDILNAISTSESGFWSWLTESGIFREDELEKDLLRIKLLYRTRGYFKVQVSQPIIKEDRERGKLNIVIPISEGSEYNTGEIEIRGGEDVIPPEELRIDFQLFPGEVFNQTFLVEDVQRVTAAFAARGYAFADVRSATEPDDEKKTIKVIYEIKKGRRVYIGRVKVQGNTRTRENVVRREVRVIEGALYDSKALTKTRSRLNRTQYFGDVRVLEKRRSGSRDVLDIDINLEERPTGSVGAGVGFSSDEGALVTAVIREDNLFGRGYKVGLRGSLSSVSQSGTFSFTDPNFQDKDFSLGGDLFITEEEFATFDNERKGARINLGKSLTDDLTAFLSYELSTFKITAVSPFARQDIIDSEGDTQLESRMSPSLVYDTRNHRFLPEEGTLFVVNPAMSGGFIGGDIDVGSMRIDFRQYHNVGSKLRFRLLKNLIWSYRVELRYVDALRGELPAFRRIYLSGQAPLRGFDRDDLGPRDSAGEAIGGYSTGLMSTEFTHPFFGPARIAFFLDVGNVWERHNAYDLTDLRYGAGVGLRVITPFGPLRLDVGYKLDKKSGERDREVHFGLGASF
ncbi:MAG: outer membrane protein assembly factor BamA [Nitrospinaceae bacterium]|nr:outer membrane protein assembly factor BamA [Nitrospinaceae bacterium]